MGLGKNMAIVYWLVLGDTGLVQSGTGRYLVLMSQYKAVFVGT